MIFQNINVDNSEALAQALTAAEIARQEAQALKAELEQKNAELAELLSQYAEVADERTDDIQ